MNRRYALIALDRHHECRMAKKLKLHQDRAVNHGLAAKTVTWATARGTSSGLNQRGRTRQESETGHKRGRQQLPQAAIHLVANWLLPRAGEFDNQLI